MTTEELVLSVITTSKGKKVHGRTRLQKIVYFLAQKLHLKVRYSPYYYGPYSEDVARAVESLVAQGLVEETVVPLESAGPFEGRMYSYSVTEEGQEYYDAMSAEEPELFGLLGARMRELLQGDPSTRALAVASKLDVVVSRAGQPVKEKDLSRRAAALGWEIAQADVDEAKTFLVTRKFVRIVDAD